MRQQEPWSLAFQASVITARPPRQLSAVTQIKICEMNQMLKYVSLNCSDLLAQNLICIWRLLTFNMSVFRQYKFEQCSTEHWQRNLEMQCELFKSLFHVKICLNTEDMTEFWNWYEHFLLSLWPSPIMKNLFIWILFLHDCPETFYNHLSFPNFELENSSNSTN